MISLFPEPAARECSRAGCRANATWQLLWRNPKIHDESRTKIWLACDEHRGYLHDFLASRNFPVRDQPFTEEDSPA